MRALAWLAPLLLLAAPAPATAAHTPRLVDAIRHHKHPSRRSAPIIEKRNSLHEPFRNPELQKRASSFLTNKTKEFAVDGASLPDIPWDIGDSYAGLLPISDAANETRKLFFWFIPTTNPDSFEEITIWLNGGPGCASTVAVVSENGPIGWDAGTVLPTPNPYSWTNLTNMLWVDQPVGVGYSEGVPNITNEIELAEEFKGFYKNFVDTFDVQGWKVYLAGESYAGYYVPYIADSFLSENDTTYFNVSGIAVNDPIIGNWILHEEVPMVPFVEANQNLYALNDTFLAALKERADECGYTDYYATYLTFPPPAAPFPTLPEPSEDNGYACDIWYDIYYAALLTNPCFNEYHISDYCPHPYSILGVLESYSPPGPPVYFNRSDVQKALHAPETTNWQQCTDTNVFGLGTDDETLADTSPGPALDGTLQRVIERTNNVIFGAGGLDGILPINGTLLVLQNLTWNGGQGLSEWPGKPFYVPYHPEYNPGAVTGAGNVGGWTAERGLTFYWVQLAGHELSGYHPGAGYRQLELLLGRIGNLSQTGDFTTQSGDYTGTSTIY